MNFLTLREAMPAGMEECSHCCGTGSHMGVKGGPHHPLCGHCDGTGRTKSLPPLPAAEPETGRTYRIDHDGFMGTAIGSYVTREGKRGLVLQQLGTKVVHVYGEKWCLPQ